MNDSSWFWNQFPQAPTPKHSDIPTWFVQYGLIIGVIGTVMAGLGIPSTLPAVAVNAAAEHWKSLPDELEMKPLKSRSVMLDADGGIIAYLFNEYRVPVPLGKVSKSMKDSILAIEDDRFHNHGGLDASGLFRAVSSKGSAGGGSTLTQQFVKNVRLNNADNQEEYEATKEVTIQRKIQELRYADSIEQSLTKEQILEGYLNISYFGDGAYGIEAAAQHFFSVSADKLNYTQGATLAGLVKNPFAYNPVKHPEAAMNRRNLVLKRLVDTGRITKDQADHAKNKPLGLKVRKFSNGCVRATAPFFCQAVLDEIMHSPAFGHTREDRVALLARGGLTIRTSMKPQVQKAARAAAHRAFTPKAEFATASATVEPGTGRVLAVAQSREWAQTQIVLAKQRYQNGSTFKPITLATALEKGWRMDKVINAKAKYCAPRPLTGCFENAASWDSGPMNAWDALAMSSNTFFTELAARTGVSDVQSMARRLGWTFPEDVTGLETATTLGVYSVSPLTVAEAYATFAARGVYCEATFIDSVADAAGNELPVPSAKCRQELDPKIADTVSKALQGVIRGDSPYRTGRRWDIGRPAMGKTGTTDGPSAVWFAGGTPQMVSAVWTGDPAGGFNNPLRGVRMYGRYHGTVDGSRGAGPIWQDTMKRALKGVPEASFGRSMFDRTKASVVVPDFTGMQLPAAVAHAEEAGLTALVDGVSENSTPLFSPGTVVSQSVKPGSALVRGESVRLTMAEGTTELFVRERASAMREPLSGGGIVSR